MGRELGKGFADFIIRDRPRTPRGAGFGGQGEEFRKWRSRVLEPRVVPFFAIFVLGMGALFLRLLWVTVIRGEYYRSLAEENRVREEVVWAPRGIIYDRNGEALVFNRPVYRRGSRLSAKGGSASGGKVQGSRQEYEYLSQEEVLELEARGEESGIELFVSREYPYGEAFTHVVGYVGEVDTEDVEKGLRLGSLIGKAGLEQSFDPVLRGTEGKVLVETDAVGRKIGELGRIDAKPGEDLYTTLDSKLQMKAAEVVGGRSGAVIVSKPSGEILVLYSSPSFDPNVFVGRELGESGKLGRSGVEEILKSEGKPLFNRAIGGVYPPGSTFKIITAAAGLEEQAIEAGSTFVDTGFIAIGPYVFRNWYYTQYGKVEGEVDVVRGIARSVDTFFYKVGEKTGIEDLAKWGRAFGIGEKLGIEIGGEAEGRMPDEEWKIGAKEERWYLGDTYHVSIGQGDVLTTPLQVNFFTAAIANGGELCRPKLTREKNQGPRTRDSVTVQGRDWGDRGNQGNGGNQGECKELGVSKETLELIREGLRQACEPGGTGFPLFKFKIPASPAGGQNSKFKIDGINFIDAGDGWVEIPVACKTGTAEFGDQEGKTHAWFTVYAPAKSPTDIQADGSVENPEIVVTALLERGGSGAYDAAPLAKEILTAYFTSRKDADRTD